MMQIDVNHLSHCEIYQDGHRVQIVKRRNNLAVALSTHQRKYYQPIQFSYQQIPSLASRQPLNPTVNEGHKAQCRRRRRSSSLCNEIDANELL